MKLANLLRLSCLLLLMLFAALPVLSLLAAALMTDASLSNGIASPHYVWEHLLTGPDLWQRLASAFSDARMLPLLLRSLVLSLSVATVVSLASWALGYAVTRQNNWPARLCLPLSFSVYLFPPVIMALAASESWQVTSRQGLFLQLFFCHCLYVFPISFVLSIGFWRQKPFAIDRMAASEGARFWGRMLAHLGVKDLVYLSVFALLIFMVSWNDIVFSRMLASHDPGARLVVDALYQRIFANADIQAFGLMALVSVSALGVSVLVSLVFSLLFYQAFVEEEGHA